MKKCMILLAAFFLLSSLASLAQAADSPHTKLLFHGHQTVKKGWGTAGWLILTDINSGGRVLSVVGPRYDSSDQRWWIEVMVGAVVAKNASGQFGEVWLLDIRFSPPPLGKHFTHWTNIEWVDLRKVKTGRFFLYYQLDANLPLGLGKIGVETENTFKPGKDSLSFGPHIVIAVSKNMKIATAYQWHRKFEGNQWWFRTLIDL